MRSNHLHSAVLATAFAASFLGAAPASASVDNSAGTDRPVITATLSPGLGTLLVVPSWWQRLWASAESRPVVATPADATARG